MYDDPDDVVRGGCRVCDYNPCMCGSQKYQSDREHREELERNEQYWSERDGNE